jgi:uncharacterized phiE125 gp8 family phage protein
MQRILYVADSLDPVTVAEVKVAARIDTDALDAELASLITSAREQAEHLTGRCYRGQVLRAELADWPADTDALAVHNATASAVRYWTGVDFSASPLDSSAYVYAPGGIGNNGTVLAPATGTSWPVLADRPVGPRVRIDLTAGPAPGAEAATVPESVRTVIKAVVSAWVKSPEALSNGVLTVNPLFERLLDGERLFA